MKEKEKQAVELVKVDEIDKVDEVDEVGRSGRSGYGEVKENYVQNEKPDKWQGPAFGNA